MSVMLYKHGGIHEMHGDNFDYIVVDEKEVDTTLTKGWFLTTTEALENKKSKRGRPSIEKPKEDILGVFNGMDKETDS